MNLAPMRHLDNTVCGMKGCSKSATDRLTLILGFSALFCNNCAETLISTGLAEPVKEKGIRPDSGFEGHSQAATASNPTEMAGVGSRA